MTPWKTPHNRTMPPAATVARLRLARASAGDCQAAVRTTPEDGVICGRIAAGDAA